MFSKGQGVSMDLVFAMFIFLFIFTVFITTWFINVDNAYEERTLQRLKQVSYETTDLLVSNRGQPVNWHLSTATDANVIGLASNPKYRVLDPDKVAALVSADYNSMKDTLGLEGYDYYFSIQNSNGVVVQSLGTNNNDVRYSITARRVVSFNGLKHSLLLKTWLEWA
ncbi:MAG: hypothetical protein GOV15_03940 [Candidatus Diapherotrites archaeon]|nr:hypothetical protein [Candidatus Diapherotrites archaeon]